MMAIVPHVTSGLGLRKFQADGFLLTRVHTERHVIWSGFHVQTKLEVSVNSYTICIEVILFEERGSSFCSSTVSCK